MQFFETTRSGFIQVLHHFEFIKDNSSVFFSSNHIYFGQKEPISIKFLDFWMVGWKFNKFFKSYLKPQVSFSLNFASLFSIMRDNSSVLFSLKLYIIWTNGAHQSSKFQTFDCSHEISSYLYFDMLLLLKVSKISAKKAQRSYVSWHWRVIQNLKKNRFVVLKMTRIWWILIWALENLKNLHFDWSLSCRVYDIWPKKVKRSYFSWHWRVMQNLQRNLHVVWKMTWGLW